MSDDFFNQPPDLRSLPKTIRDQMNQSTPLRKGEVHSTVTLHNTNYKGTTMPNGRVWVEPYLNAKPGQGVQEGVQLSIYDPAGTRLLVVARLPKRQTLTFITAAMQAYLQQNGSLEDLQDAITEALPAPRNP